MVDEATSVMSPLNPRITVCRVYSAACNGWKDTGYTITIRHESWSLWWAAFHTYIYMHSSTKVLNKDVVGHIYYCGFPKVLHVMEGISQDLLLSPWHHVCNCFWRRCDLCMEYLNTRIYTHSCYCMYVSEVTVSLWPLSWSKHAHMHTHACTHAHTHTSTAS